MNNVISYSEVLTSGKITSEYKFETYDSIDSKLETYEYVTIAGSRLERQDRAAR